MTARIFADCFADDASPYFYVFLNFSPLQIALLMTRLRMLMSKDWVKAMPSDDEQEANREVFSVLLI